MLVRLALVPTAEAAAPMVTEEAAEDSKDTESPGHHVWALVAVIKESRRDLLGETSLA